MADANKAATGATATSGVRTQVSVVLGTADRPALVRWCTLVDRPWSYDSYAILTDAGPIAIDPSTPLGTAGDELARLLGDRPAAIVLTSDSHERDAYALRERWGAPVWAPAYGTAERGGELEGTPDHLYEDGDSLPGGLRAHRLVGGGFPGETALVWDRPSDSAAGAVVFTGDAVNGRVTTDLPGAHGRRGLPGLYAAASAYHLEHCRPDELRQSLRPLLREPIRALCGAHGEPWLDQPNETLEQLLSLDWRIWFAEKRHPVVR